MMRHLFLIALVVVTGLALQAQDLSPAQSVTVCADAATARGRTTTDTRKIQEIRDLCKAATPIPTPAPGPTPAPVPVPPPLPSPSPVPAGGLVQPSSLTAIGTFRLPQDKLGSQWGFGSYAGCCGQGAYGVAFNPARNSLYVGGHPYEQRVAEIAIPASLTGGSPVASALSALVDPFEGRIGSINPGDPNTKVIGGAAVVGGQLYISAFAYYDGSGTQNKSLFIRPTNLATLGQVTGPLKVGTLYPGWVDRLAAPIPAEWQAALGGAMLLGGSGGNINSLQSWGPSVSAWTPTTADPSPATLVLGYPMAHPLADTSVGNLLWSQSDYVTGVVFIDGTRSVLFFGYHGLGPYCYGPGVDCGDKDNASKGSHAYPYRSQVWAYDANDLAAVKAGTKQSYDVQPYATWNLDPSFTDIQGAAYDPATKRLFVSQVGGDSAGNQPLIRVYQLP